MKLPPPLSDPFKRDRPSIALDLKSPNGIALIKSLLNHSDVLVDPFRPGVLESIGLDPKDLLHANPRLIIARLTGFRRDGPFAQMAGHDINYLAVSGLLSQFLPSMSAPSFPANVVADFAGGGLICTFGIMAALYNRTRTGKGQVVEANVVDGSAFLGFFSWFLRKRPLRAELLGEDIIGGQCPWYNVYECKDRRYMAVGAIEERYFKVLLKGLGCDQDLLDTRDNPTTWPTLGDMFRKRFLQKTRQEWELVFTGRDACCTPVLSQDELEDQRHEQRPVVGLLGSPNLAIPNSETSGRQVLATGASGESLLEDWTRWIKGKDYKMESGGLVKIEASKL